MSLVTIFLVLFYFLGFALGPLLLAVATRSYGDGRGYSLANWSFGLGLKSIWRPALTFNAANELELKRRGYDEEHDEQKIAFGGMLNKVERFLFDPQNRIHDFYGTPFAFVDERFGIVLDPRDALLGRMLLEKQAGGVYTSRVERGQRLVESVLAVFELPKGHTGARLPDVWGLVGGSFDAQLVRKIHEFYRKGQAPKNSTTAVKQLLVPVGAFIAVLLIGVFASGQGAGGGGSAAQAVNQSRVSIGNGTLALLLAAPAVRASRLRDLFVSIIFVGMLGLLSVGLYFALPFPATVIGLTLPLGIWGIILLILGMVTIPAAASWMGRGLGPIGNLLGLLFIVIGLLRYDKPVITLVDEHTYRLREYDDHDWNTEPAWYRFALTRVGIGLDNSLDVWNENVIESPARVRSMGQAVADGGVQVDAAGTAPPGHKVTPLIEHEGIYGYVPTDVNDDALYIRTDLTTGWFEEAGQNRRLMTAALETAKERFGGGDKPLSDRAIMTATFAALIAGAIFDWLVFF